MPVTTIPCQQNTVSDDYKHRMQIVKVKEKIIY